MRRAPICVAVLVLLVCSEASAVPLRLRILDQSGAAFPDVLVIVKSLAGKGEIFRALTDQTGGVAERDLSPGLYRAIATCPTASAKLRSPIYVSVTRRWNLN